MSSSAAWFEVPITQSVRYSTILFLEPTQEDTSKHLLHHANIKGEPGRITRGGAIADLNFISWQKDRSSRLSIITSTSWHSLVLIWMAWTMFPRMRTYLRGRSRSRNKLEVETSC